MMLEEYTSFIDADVLDIWTLMGQSEFLEVYRRYGPVLEDMLFVSSEEEWLDFVEQQGPELDEHALRLHLAAWQDCCIELGCYEGDVTEKLLAFLEQELPDKIFTKLECPKVCLDLDEPGQDLTAQLKPYRDQLNPWGCKLITFTDDTYCDGVDFIFLETPQAW